MTRTELSPSRLAQASAVVPSPRQLAWQRRELYAFVHFGMNTMTDREWGAGHEDPALFDPADVDVDQWVRVFASAGMRAVILTAKHHDGFCLWPSRRTGHTVAASPWRGGRGDLVREVADACARAGLGFGVYLSPWDRTKPTYGTGAAYDDFFVAQLTELLTGYGPVFSVWLDGANGEGPDGRTQLYDWDRYYEVVRRLQPGAAISVCGPDVRWCGNEAGHTRADEWSVVPASLRDAERVASRSQRGDDPSFARLVRSDEDDLGSRAALAATDDELVWYPAEVNTSIRPGWFHHPAQDDEVRTPAELFRIYRRSVGGNSTFLLNVPPDRSGRLAAPDVAALRGLGALVAELADRDMAPAARVAYSSAPLDGPPRDGAVWAPAHGDPAPAVRLSWPEPRTVDGVVLAEDVAHGQQVEDVVVRVERADGRAEGPGEIVAWAGSVGYRRILDLAPVEVTALTVEIGAHRGPVRLAELAVLRPSALPGGEHREAAGPARMPR
ncbi:alpha-L-fucosidase [Isoptericola sp. BMS4]|uniref:alpha-L-fucosidase n=1 Tax=Isoptericola sp. BMS4 TaxID=2527875 RepID=UPI001F0E9F30|nr:alpha-L-fucosidase [Isoptericola sp. BMS4]